MKKVIVALVVIGLLCSCDLESSDEIFHENVKPYKDLFLKADEMGCNIHLHRFYTHEAYVTIDCDGSIYNSREFRSTYMK